MRRHLLAFGWLSSALIVACAGASAACRRAESAPKANAAVAPAATSASASPSASPAKPAAPVVVTLVVDQLAAWVLAERIGELRPSGGFARLAREGTYLREARYAHAVCDTAPGHAALYTCAPPHESGIHANEVIDAAGARVSVLADASVHPIDAFAVRDGETGSSAARLRVPTLADELKKARPDAIVLSLSLKDRGAIFGGGRSPTASVWYDAGKGSFVTSTAFAKAPLPWMAASLKEDYRPLLRSTWEAPLRPEWVKAHATTDDTQAGEGDYVGLGAKFPHAVGSTSSPTKALRATPMADHLLLTMALRALDAHGAGTRPTLLAVSLSANDYVGHTFGPDSWEAWDELDRLDVELDAFFRALDARFGEAGWAALLSGDHGVPPMPETSGSASARPWCAHPEADPWKRPCAKGERLHPDGLTAELQKAAEAAAGKGRWVAGVADPYVILTDAGRGSPAALRAITRTLTAHPGVARVLETKAMPAVCPPESDESEDALLCRARVAGAPGDLYVLTRPGSFFDPLYAIGAGTSHGTPYLFDRAVPVLARAPGRVAAGRVLSAPGSFRTFAATAAALLGAPAPGLCAGAPALTGRGGP